MKKETMYYQNYYIHLLNGEVIGASAHRHAAGKDRKKELPHRQPEKHTLRIVADFLIYLDFHISTAPS